MFQNTPGMMGAPPPMAPHQAFHQQNRQSFYQDQQQ